MILCNKLICLKQIYNYLHSPCFFINHLATWMRFICAIWESTTQTQNGYFYIALQLKRVHNQIHRWINQHNLQSSQYSQVLRSLFSDLENGLVQMSSLVRLNMVLDSFCDGNKLFSYLNIMARSYQPPASVHGLRKNIKRIRGDVCQNLGAELSGKLQIKNRRT